MAVLKNPDEGTERGGRESTFSTNAFSGRTILPVMRNNTTKVMTAITPSTSGRREVMDATLSTLSCATPVKSTGRPAGPGTACSARSCLLEASENSAALL